MLIDSLRRLFTRDDFLKRKLTKFKTILTSFVHYLHREHMFDRFYKERKEADLLSKKSFAELNQEQARNMSTLEKRKNH